MTSLKIKWQTILHLPRSWPCIQNHPIWDQHLQCVPLPWTYRWVMDLRRLQKKGWGRGPRFPFRARPAASVRMYLLLIPWMKMASKAQQSKLASPSSLVTTESDVTYRFCSAFSDCANVSLICSTHMRNQVEVLLLFWVDVTKGVVMLSSQVIFYLYNITYFSYKIRIKTCPPKKQNGENGGMCIQSILYWSYINNTK